MKDALCRAFCDSLSVSEVPAGLAVATPFRRGADTLAFFVVYKAGRRDVARLEDDGLTVAYLQDVGINPFDGPRGIALGELMDEFGVGFDERECVFHTPFAPADEAPRSAMGFLGFLLRVQDFALFTRERVEATFKADVFAAVSQHYEGRAAVVADEPATPDLKDYVADIVIRPNNYPPLALYVGGSETKALEAIVFRQATTLAGITCGVMLVVQPRKQPRMKKRTVARVAGNVPFVVFNRPGEALARMDEELFGAPFLPRTPSAPEIRH